MRVVIVHNRYRSANPSGENRVVADDIDQLRADGVDVVPYVRDSDEIDHFRPVTKALVGVRPLVSPSDVLALRRILREHRPDIVHVHNVYPLISPWIVRTAHTQGVPIVQTVHNYRHVCVNGTFFRDGEPCVECTQVRLPWPAVRHGCYQASSLRSVPMAASLAAHRRTWNLVDRFIAVGDPVAEHLRQFGIDDRRIEVRGNMVADPGEPAPLGRGALFVGRLDADKGLGVLLDAWRLSGLGDRGETLSIAGDGERRDDIRAAAAHDPSVRPLGLLDQTALAEAYRACALVVMPSLVPEADGIAATAALAHGRPLLVSDRGALPSKVADGSGWTVEPTTSRSAAALGEALTNRRVLEEAASRARIAYLETKSAFRPLTSIYAGLGAL